MEQTLFASLSDKATVHSNASSMSVWYLIIVAICVWVIRRGSICSRTGKAFPGPPSDPILGHLRTFPRKFPWVKLTEWSKQYGDIVALSFLGRPILVINSAEEAYEFMEKRGSIYSDRVDSVLHSEILGMKYFVGIVRYGIDFRKLRRFSARYFNSNKHASLFPILEEELSALLISLINVPDKFEEHLDMMASGMIMKSVYGLPAEKDHLELVSAVFELGSPGLNFIDLIPIIRYIPSWFPGAGLLRKAEKVKYRIKRMIDKPYDQVKAKRDHVGTNRRSLVSTLITENEQLGTLDYKCELLIKQNATQLNFAAVETFSTTLLSFLWFMSLHPEIVKKAQGEIDDVIGDDRLPTLEDRARLPYVDCILKEVLRFNPPAPLGVPHAAMKGGIRHGMVIEEGTIIVPNIWAMMRDKRHFSDPDTFNPDRFLSSNSNQTGNRSLHPLNTFKPDDPSSMVFGFGRRICPGRFFADAAVWLVMANLLFVFDILVSSEPPDDQYQVSWRETSGGLTARPKEFQARIVPRSSKHVALATNSPCN